MNLKQLLLPLFLCMPVYAMEQGQLPKLPAEMKRLIISHALSNQSENKKTYHSLCLSCKDLNQQTKTHLAPLWKEVDRTKKSLENPNDSYYKLGELRREGYAIGWIIVVVGSSRLSTLSLEKSFIEAFCEAHIRPLFETKKGLFLHSST